jgi:hypothetical protein
MALTVGVRPRPHGAQRRVQPGFQGIAMRGRRGEGNRQIIMRRRAMAEIAMRLPPLIRPAFIRTHRQSSRFVQE